MDEGVVKYSIAEYWSNSSSGYSSNKQDANRKSSTALFKELLAKIKWKYSIWAQGRG